MPSISSVRVPEDLGRAVDRAVATGGLPLEDRDATFRFLEERIRSVGERDWFPPEGVLVQNEVALIGRDGTEHRPDRVLVREDGSVVVIDYTNGDTVYLKDITWESDEDIIYSRNPVRAVNGHRITYGDGFVSDGNMSNLRITRQRGTIEFED